MNTYNPRTDREHLTTRMYADDGPLGVRIRTHELYTQPKMDFTAWVLDLVPWQGDETVLDIGCGSGVYVVPICRHLTRGGRLLCGDLSFGMLAVAAALMTRTSASRFNGDAVSLPLADGSCDLVLANHMLYHVPDIERAVAEAHRVLKPGGYLVAATNARDSMRGFVSLVVDACLATGHAIDATDPPTVGRFSLANGHSLVGAVFRQVKMHQFDSALVFPNADPVVAYIDSMRPGIGPLLPSAFPWEEMLREAAKRVEAVIDRQGEYRVLKTTGAFVARKAAG